MEDDDEIKITEVRKRNPEPVTQSPQQKNESQGNRRTPEIDLDFIVL